MDKKYALVLDFRNKSGKFVFSSPVKELYLEAYCQDLEGSKNVYLEFTTESGETFGQTLNVSGAPGFHYVHVENSFSGELEISRPFAEENSSSGKVDEATDYSLLITGVKWR